MSLEAWVAVLEAGIPDGPKKAVLSGLANHAGPDGRHAYPSVPRLSVYSGLTDRTISRVLAELVADGLLKVVSQGGGRGHPTEYELDLKALAQMRDPRLDALDLAVMDRRERVTESQGSFSERVTSTTERVTGDARKGDSLSPEPYLTVINPPREPSRSSDGGRSAAAPQTLWVSVLGHLQGRFRKVEFETWLRDTQVVSETDGELVVGTANSHALSWLQDRAREPAEAALEKMADRPMSLRFVVLERAAA
jgi:hypothetical protein